MSHPKEYEEKRNIKSSGEPSWEGNKRSAKDPVFGIHQHDAQNLHYDFRLECGGVLKSWAVPKGPSTDPSEKRLAIQVEDHPLEYIEFEGIIPEGNYGAGKVLLWDKGTFENITCKDDKLKELSEAIEDGHFIVNLKGIKICGGYAMTRINKDKKQWLLVKMNDDEADARRNPTSTEPQSVKSGKTIGQI